MRAKLFSSSAFLPTDTAVRGIVGATPGGTSRHRHLVDLEVAGESVGPQLALLVLFLVVVLREAPQVHGGREETVHAS